jgi:hypothetical protein
MKFNIVDLIGIGLVVSVLVYGGFQTGRFISYLMYYTQTYDLLRDTNNCKITMNKDKVWNSDLNASQMKGIKDAVEKWKLVCSMKGE